MGGRIDFALLKEAGRNELVKLLSKIYGPKAIIWDKELASRFELVADFSFLGSHEVNKMFYISNDKLPQNNISNLIFITRPLKKNMDLINTQIRMENLHHGPDKKEFHLWCVPRVTLLCQQQLEQHGVYGAFSTIDELPIFLYRLESDLATLELPLCYRDFCLNVDPTGLYYVSRALMSIQGVFGLIPNVFGKGEAAQKVFELIVGMRRELGGREPQVPPQIDQLILIDRSVDLISTLATQLTYEGLIDQFFGIRNSVVKLPAGKFSSPSHNDRDGSLTVTSSMKNEEYKSFLLTSSDPLYAEIRDLNFFAVAPRLSNEAREVSSQFEKRHDANTLSDLKQFVDKLPKMQIARDSLSTQTAIWELVTDRIFNGEFRPSLQAEQELLKGSDTDKINPYIEECIIQKEPLVKVLRLICLQSIINCGLKPKIFEFYKKEIIYTYGYQNIVTLENLEKVGLFAIQVGKSPYSTVRKTLRLSVDDVNETKPSDISYVHSGYAPLSVRLVEFLQYPGWRAITEVLKLLPGPTLSETQQLPSALRQRRNSGNSLQSSMGGEPSTALVCFIGGCTYAEVAALRFLAAKIDQGGPEYVILTTKMINGNSFVESFMEPLNPKS